jgi:hypothetical protein
MLHSLFVADVAVMVSMLVLANLSQRLGEALKIPPYYRILYVTTALVLAAFALDTFRETLQAPVLDLVAIGIRALATAIAVAVCLPYWRWVFSEIFGKGR